MIARLLVKSPCALRSGGIEGSSGVDQALRMKSIDVAGSEREHTAHISSSRLETSMSSSTTITYFAGIGDRTAHRRQMPGLAGMPRVALLDRYGGELTRAARLVAPRGDHVRQTGFL